MRKLRSASIPRAVETNKKRLPRVAPHKGVPGKHAGARSGPPPSLKKTVAPEKGAGIADTGGKPTLQPASRMPVPVVDETVVNRTGVNRMGVNRMGVDKSSVDKTGVDKTSVDKTGVDKNGGAQAADPQFDERIYLAVNPDVRDAIARGEITDGLTHWLQFGQAEYARRQRPSILNAPHYPDSLPEAREYEDQAAGGRIFDAEGYLYLNADVRQAVSGDARASEDHWLNHGRQERRAQPNHSPFAGRTASPADVLARPFGVNIFAPLTATSGLGTAARGIVRALALSNTPMELWNYDTSHGYLRIAEADRARCPIYRVNLCLANADILGQLYEVFPSGFFDGAYTIGVWQWELASFRPDWFTSFGGVDEVWTNSEFQRAAIAASSPVPVLNIHLPVEPIAAPGICTRERFGIPAGAFAFLCVFDVGSTSARKNPFAVIEAFAEAFGGRAGVTLVLKFHSNRHETGFIAKLNRAVRGIRHVVALPEAFSEAEMADLRACCDCLVSAHRSEGFGLNIAEFMALGKPVVATNYSGSTDILDEAVGFPVDYKLVEINGAAGPYCSGYVWAEPDRDSLIAQMRRVLEEPAEAARRGRAAAERMATLCSHAAISRAMRKRFKELDLDARPIRFLPLLGRSPARAVFTSRTEGARTEVARIEAGRPEGSLADAARPSARSINLLRALPLFSIIVPVYNVSGKLLELCIQSVLQQTYPYWELCLCNDGSTAADTLAALDLHRGASAKIKVRHLAGNGGISAASNAAAETATGDYLVLLDNDDELDPDALWEAAAAISADQRIDCLYSDEDKIDRDGNLIDHFHKPRWSPEHLESVMYVLHMLVVRKRLFLELGGFRSDFDGAQDFDLMLRCSRATEHIHHIARVLYHWRSIPGSSAQIVNAKPAALTAGLRALEDHARQKYGDDATVEAGLTAGTFRLRRPVSGRMRATLLILTNNSRADLPQRGHVQFVDHFVDSILQRTDYPNYEVVVVDNSSLTNAQLKRFAAIGVRVENFEPRGGGFNYAAKANFAVSCAQTEHIVLLNDDMEVIRAGWLTALMELSQDLEIGAVGARLLHFDGTIQHVGMVLGVNGNAAHVYHSFPGDFIGYNAFTHIIRNYSVVTAACLATRRSVLAQVGGFDEAFAIDFNDTDLCLRIGQAGYRIAYTPFAELYHYEGASARRATQNPEEVRLFGERWAKMIENDPYYNQNLARDRLDYGRRDWAPRLAIAAE